MNPADAPPVSAPAPDPVHDLVARAAFTCVGYRIEADLGATVTRLALTRPSGQVVVDERPSTVDGCWLSMAQCLRHIAARELVSVRALLARTERLVLATTAVTDLMRQHRGVTTTLVSDSDNLGRLNLAPELPDGLRAWLHRTVPPSRRIPLDGSLSARSLAAPVASRELTAAAAGRVWATGCIAVAVALPVPSVNASTERRLARALARPAGGPQACLAHRVYLGPSDALRAYVTVLHAYVGPAVRTDLLTLGRRVRALGFGGDLVVVPSDALPWTR